MKPSDFVMPHFIVQELVDPRTYSRFGDDAIRYMDPRLIANLNALREQVGVPMVINNWNVGGDRKASGLRLPDTPFHSTWSAHSYGKAVDIIGRFDATAVRTDIVEGRIVLPYPLRLEAGIPWIHMDTLNTGGIEFVIMFGE